MPFLGQDWRSPGEQWVRTSEGWERLGLWRLKMFENLNENVFYRLLKLANEEFDCLSRSDYFQIRASQPYVLVREVTKEQKMQTCVAEALTRLDVVGAVRDPRRVNYVCKLVSYLIEHKITSLSGMSQKIVINILEQIVNQAIKTNCNLRVAQKLLNEMQNRLEQGIYDHMGCQSLWDNHRAVIQRLQYDLKSVSIPERNDDGKLTMSDLPDEVIRCILIQLADHRDLVNAGLTESRTFALCEETSFWRNLCYFHFSARKWNSVLRKGEGLESIGWKTLYMRLMKRYGLRDVFAEMLHLCRHCNALFWQLHGHPCPVSNVDAESHPVSPTMFADLFSA